MFYYRSALILGDGLVHGIQDYESCKNDLMLKVQIKSFPGCTPKDLIEKLGRKEINLNGINTIVIAVGTETIMSTNPVEMSSEFEKLAEKFLELNSSIKLIVSLLIPRLCDNEASAEPIKTVNRLLKASHIARKFQVWHSFKPFIHKRIQHNMSGAVDKLREELYAEDGLHLNDKGKRILKQQFQMAVSLLG